MIFNKVEHYFKSEVLSAQLMQRMIIGILVPYVELKFEEGDFIAWLHLGGCIQSSILLGIDFERELSSQISELVGKWFEVKLIVLSCPKKEASGSSKSFLEIVSGPVVRSEVC